MSLELTRRETQNTKYSSLVPLPTTLVKNATFGQSSSMNIETMKDNWIRITLALQVRQAMKPETRYRLTD